MDLATPTNVAVTIGNVSLGHGATAILGTNNVASDPKSQDQSAKRCKDVLFVSDPSLVRAELINLKGGVTEGTCRWIQHNEIYLSWFNTQDSCLLWISGGPGRGKTMLSIFLTQEWEALPYRVLYVFCGDKSTNDEVTILRSLLYQVLDQSPTMASHVEDRLGSEERTKRTLSSRGDLWAMLASMLKDPRLGPTICLIDGLDECHRDSTRWLLNNLRHVFDKESRSRLLPSSPFKLAIISRDMAGLRSYPRLNLETNKKTTAEDVARVIDAKMKEHDRFLELDDEFIREVKRTLRDRSDGTFLWVGFAIQELLSAETKTEMRLALDTTPQGLSALYSNILLRIKSPVREKIAQLLHWVALARHSLTPSALAGALDVDVQTILDLVAMSGSLLTLSALSKHTKRDMALSTIPSAAFSRLRRCRCEVVKLVHASVSDFLKGEVNDDTLPPKEFRMRAGEIELEITERCLSEVEVLVSHSSVQLDNITAHNFSLYAVFFWPKHAGRCEGDLERLLDSDNAFFRSRDGASIRWKWWEVYLTGTLDLSRDYKTHGISLLHVSSALGLLPWVARLLQDMSLTRNEVDDPDSRGWTALCYALNDKHVEVAQMLVDHGASLTRDIKRNYPYYSNTESFKPIHKAMQLGPRLAEPFLNKVLGNINPNTPGRGPPFRDRALEESLFRMVVVLDDARFIPILCNKGATLDSDIARLALEDAFESDASVALMKLLLQHGASTRDLDPRLVLKSHVEPIYDRVKTLLDHGMDPNSSKEGHLLLHQVVRFGPDLVELLLDYGAHVDRLDDYGMRALVIALAKGEIESAAMLLKRGADPTIKDSYGNTVLHAMVKLGRPEAVKFLLQNGSDINIQDNDGRTALDSVLEHWDRSMAKLLPERGACSNIGGGTNSATPLRAAILNRHVDIVRVLLEHGADFSQERDGLGTPLGWNQQFNDEGKARIAELLLEKGGANSRD